MKVLISGATGLIGSSLAQELKSGGHHVTSLTRSPTGENNISWDPDAGTVDGSLEGTDAVVHLAGESIAEGRWTVSKKRRIMDSRK
jgi:NAD dependent epimerase/dehydratase family enzyme